MSLGYAESLRKGVWKGKCGAPELFDSPKDVKKGVDELVKLIRNSQHLVAYTGAGISVSAGIPDFRGPDGVWTREENGDPPPPSVSFSESRPTLTHMALVALYQRGILKFITTQNVDNLHYKSGIPMDALSELHGNVFKEKCGVCLKEYVRDFEIGSVGLKKTGRQCVCGGDLKDTTLDWNDALPEDHFSRSDLHARKSDLALCLGTSLQIRPACNLPVKSTRANGKPTGPGDMVIVNLQSTPQDRHASVIIHAKCDQVMEMVMEKLGIEIPAYNSEPKTIEKIEEGSQSTSTSLDSNDASEEDNKSTLKIENITPVEGESSTLTRKRKIGTR
eukprot:TRINITY_DN666_c0_g2_i2.p1 TRINITY_DN666_c0_g2~~TRINITY_DN666_c0_g2_i2.p1  ORF type:complete len:333 (-),score=44.16 TRINITY_DN666_c0_g2_i2:124-1122(-)